MSDCYDTSDDETPDDEFAAVNAPIIVRPFTPEPWTAHGACRHLDPDWFFPEVGEDHETAKIVCATCPVRVECLEYALRANEKLGCWGGTSAKQRRVLRKGGAAAEAMRRSIDNDMALRARRGMPAPPPPRKFKAVAAAPDPYVHGNRQGVDRHRSRGEALCPECRLAACRMNANRAARRRASKLAGAA